MFEEIEDILHLEKCLLMQLKAVGPVAILGGLLQIMTLMFLCGITAVV